jgi:hypothetical protein
MTDDELRALAVTMLKHAAAEDSLSQLFSPPVFERGDAKADTFITAEERALLNMLGGPAAAAFAGVGVVSGLVQSRQAEVKRLPTPGNAKAVATFIGRSSDPIALQRTKELGRYLLECRHGAKVITAEQVPFLQNIQDILRELQGSRADDGDGDKLAAQIRELVYHVRAHLAGEFDA